MEEEMTKAVPEGEGPKSAVEVVAEILTRKFPASTFLKNVGLKPSTSSKFSKSNAAVTAQVLDLEEKLQRSQQQTEVMREEMAELKKKAEEAEAAQAERDKSYQLLLQKTQENEARFAHMMSLLQGNPT